MIEYKVVTTNVKSAEDVINELAREGWQVISTNTVSGMSITVNSTPMIVTFGRKVG